MSGYTRLNSNNQLTEKGFDSMGERSFLPVNPDWNDLPQSPQQPDDNANDRKTFVQDDEPTTNFSEGDFWIKTNDNNHLYTANSSLQWVSARDGSIFSGAWDDITGATKPADNADVTADNETFSQNSDIDALQTTNAPAAAGADVTGSNTAANITGQGALATKASVDLATGEVTNKTADNVVAARNYDAVVATSGGDYTDIQSAIDAGKTNIFVRKGTYTLSADITLVSGVSIYGEDKYDTIININGDRQIKAVGDTPYTTGTISATNGDATITGSGTSWSANLAANDYIVIYGKGVYKIASVTDNTHLEIEIAYQGDTISGIGYTAGTFINNIHISEVTIKGHNVGSFEGALYLYGVVNSEIDNVIVTLNDLEYTYGIHLDTCYNNKLTNIRASHNGYAGIKLSNSTWNILNNIDSNSNGYYGIWLDSSSDYNKLSNISADSNNYAGLLIRSEFNELNNINANGNEGYGLQYSGGRYNTLSNIQTSDNGLDGIYLGSLQYSSFVNLNVFRNGQNGITLNGCLRNTIQGIFRDNGQDADDTYSDIILQATSTYNQIIGCNINCTLANKSKYGIRENSSADDYNIISNNNVQNAATTNISIQGTNTVIGHNSELFPTTPSSAPTTDYQVSNKKYVDDSIPVGKISIVTTDVTIANTTTETNLIQVSIPANTLGTANGVKARIFMENIDKATGGGFTIRTKYGSTTMVTLTGGTNAADDRHGYIDVLLLANGTNTQEASSSFLFSTSGDLTNLQVTYDADKGTASETESGALNLTITWQWAYANAGDTATMSHAIIEAIN